MITSIGISLGDGSFIPFRRNMGLEIKGREMELLAFIASLEANRKIGNNVVDNIDGEEVAKGEEVIS